MVKTHHYRHYHYYHSWKLFGGQNLGTSLNKSDRFSVEMVFADMYIFPVMQSLHKIVPAEEMVKMWDMFFFAIGLHKLPQLYGMTKKGEAEGNYQPKSLTRCKCKIYSWDSGFYQRQIAWKGRLDG
mmetsp:Transcript_33431/g.81152  ORF Transcript_33431/g.81152 Transcript_33431/m.81152 type:complete len:126 (-) Transcript_33431:464-841(-)